MVMTHAQSCVCIIITGIHGMDGHMGGGGGGGGWVANDSRVSL